MKRRRAVPRKAAPAAKRKKPAARPATGKTGPREEIEKLVQSLQVYQVELEHQNQELRLTEQELEESRARYIDLFDFAPIPYVALDREGAMKEVNVSACVLLGVDRENLIARRFGAFVAPEDKQLFSSFLKGVVSSPGKHACRLNVMSNGKKPLYVSLEGVRSADTNGSDPRCQVALIDMSDYKKLEGEYKKVSAELGALKAARNRTGG